MACFRILSLNRSSSVNLLSHSVFNLAALGVSALNNPNCDGLNCIHKATVAAKHGQRTVLFVSLLGSAVTCSMFGTCTSLREAIAVRLLQGIFAGAVGVARGSVTLISDASNEGRAYAILGYGPYIVL